MHKLITGAAVFFTCYGIPVLTGSLLTLLMR
jgi:hypothetical protein